MKGFFTYLWVFSVSIALVSCHHHNEEGHDHNHEHAHDECCEHDHEAKLQLIAYGNQWEVYAEVQPLAVNESSEILAHFTFLENFKPRTAGNVVAIFEQNGKRLSQTASEPVSPGIYRFAITPKAEGSGILYFLLDADTLSVQTVTVFENAHEAMHEAAEHQVKSSNAVTFTKEQSWKVDFSTAVCRVEPFGQVIKTVAQVLPSQGDEQMVIAKTSGIVLFTTDAVPGKTVSRGMRLGSVESGRMIDNNLSVRFQEATSVYERAKAEYERKKELAKSRIVSDKELVEAKTDYDRATAVYNNYRANFTGGSAAVNSPIQGFIKQIFIENGQYVEAGQAIASVSQNKNISIRADVQAKYYPQLNHIKSAVFKMNGSKNTYALEELNGKLLSYGKSADIDNPLIPVIFQVNNTVDFVTGSLIDVYIKFQSENSVVSIPNEALIEEMGNYFVFVQLTPELFEKTEVVPGSTDGRYTEIVSGLTGRERVVAKGAILVKLAQASGKLDAHSGHHH